MALEMCAADAGEADRRRATSSQPSASTRPRSDERSFSGVSCGAISTASASWGKPQLPQKAMAAAPMGFRARLEGQIAGAKSAAVRKTPPPSTAVAKREPAKKAKPRAAVPQALQLNRRMDLRIVGLGGLTDQPFLPCGFGEVWDVRDESSGRCYALKHITTARSASAISEIRVGISLFPRVRLEVDASTLQLVISATKHKSMVFTQQHEADQVLDSLQLHRDNSDHSHDASSKPRFTELFRVFQENRDFWLLYERGGRTLHELVFDIHGEFHKGSRVYRLEHRALYQQMRADPAIVQTLLKQLLEAVKILSEHQVVHADIKPDNILLQWRLHQHEPPPRAVGLCVHLVDFGSAVTTERNRYPPATQSSKSDGGGGGTPEYVPPEALVPFAPPPPSQRPQSSSSLRSASNTTAGSSESLSIQSKGSHSSSFDMWSVGAVFLELLSGFPLWFGYRSRIELEGKEYWVKNGGLFTTKHRDPASIQQRQLHVVADMERSLQSFPAGMLHDWPKQTADSALDLLRQMLDPSPRTRATPEAALSHPFLR